VQRDDRIAAYKTMKHSQQCSSGLNYIN